MIRSLFDTDDLPEEKNESVDETEMSPLAGTSLLAVTAGNAEQKVSSEIADAEPQREVSDSAGNLEIGKPDSSSKTLPSNPDQTISNALPTDPVAAEDISERDDNVLQLEKEIAKIEEEVRLEQAADLGFSPTESPASDQAVAEPAGQQQDQAGIYTSALEKEQHEKQDQVPLEKLLLIPDLEPGDPPEPKIENTGFILPGRVEQQSETTGFILPLRTESTNDDGPEIFGIKPESKAELIRKSGLAWSAGIAFFASVVFLMIIGWFADLLLGTDPWGLVVGIIIGSIIGFVQLFRLTSQILKDR